MRVSLIYCTIFLLPFVKGEITCVICNVLIRNFLLLILCICFRLTKDDRIGKYKNRDLGFIGMCCKHCGGQPGYGRYFPGSFNSFLSGKNSENMVDHMLKECSACPDQLRSILSDLEERESQSKSKPPHGSRKRFFGHIWSQLRAYPSNSQQNGFVTGIDDNGNGSHDVSLSYEVAITESTSSRESGLEDERSLVKYMEVNSSKDDDQPQHILVSRKDEI
jgi:hypothetical protein